MTAREFLDTPFSHQGRVKGIALDCVGLPLMVGEELHLSDRNGVPFSGRDSLSYSSQPMGRFVHEECQRRLIEKPVSEMRPGDIITLRNPVEPCHVAIVSDMGGYLGIVHAYGGGPRKTVEHILDAKWRRRIEGCFAFPGVES